MKHEKSVGAAVYKIEKNELYFLIEYMAKGHISVPKGHVEGTETETETAVREIREETGLEVDLDTVFRHDVYYSPYPDIQKQVIFFTARPTGGEMKNQEEEVSRLEWLPYRKALETVTYDTDREVLAHAAVYLGIKYGLYIDESGDAFRLNGNRWYREHAVDIHSHVLVGLDDGAQKMEDALELLRLDLEEGCRVVFTTPHYGAENGYAPGHMNIWLRFEDVMNAAREKVPGLRLHIGTEWYCAENIVERIREHEAWPLADSDWYLVEFLEWGEVTEPAEVMLRRLKAMKDNGIKTILAHPERYRAIQNDWDLAKRICDLGVKLQVNAYDLLLNSKEQTRNLAQWMAKEELISFIGSDMHGPVKRPPKMKEGIRWLYENVDEEYANEIVRINAEKYLGVEKLNVC